MTTDNILENINYECNDMDSVENILIANGYKYHHTAMHRGYITRKKLCKASRYNGRLGKGIILDIPSYKGTQFHYRAYWFKDIPAIAVNK